MVAPPPPALLPARADRKSARVKAAHIKE